MTEHAAQPRTSTRILILLLGLCLLVLLIFFIKERLTHPALTQNRAGSEMHFQASKEMIQRDADEIGALMQLLKNHPNDSALLLKLVNALMKAERWDAAQQFAHRLLAKDEKSFDAHFLLGIILHQIQNDEEAAKELEHALQLKEDGPARYSLAILYLYFLNKKEEGRAQLEAALKIPDLSSELKKSLEEELVKLSKAQDEQQDHVNAPSAQNPGDTAP